ncbi:hypothetical protein BH11BAC4_BH11BAC4_21650 [soil metagenome]
MQEEFIDFKDILLLFVDSRQKYENKKPSCTNRTALLTNRTNLYGTGIIPGFLLSFP